MAKDGNPILVVEDDPEISELLGAYVRIAGFDYHAASDGAAALRQAHELRPSLIVLDVMLPDTDGFEICRRLKGDQHTRHIPVVMLTALDREEHRKMGCECGATAYMTKPFDPDRLLDLIRQNVQSNGQD